jgi:DUF1365 family protein
MHPLSYTIAGLVVAAGILTLGSLKRRKSAPHQMSHGYVIRNKVTHHRLLPQPASHTFNYSTLFFLVSLNALETHSLDLGRSWIFGYGGIYGRITGLRAAAYLQADEHMTSIKRKLCQVLRLRGMPEKDLEDAWMLTMPSYLGFEGINPLTIYYCYRNGGEPWVVILEVSIVV